MPVLGLEPLDPDGSDAVEHPDLERLALHSGRRAIVDHGGAVLRRQRSPCARRGSRWPLAMNRLRGKVPRRVLASPSRKTMSPSRSTFRPQLLQRVIAAFVGSGGSCPVDRARVAAGPQKFPVQWDGFIQSVASAAPWSGSRARSSNSKAKSWESSRARPRIGPTPGPLMRLSPSGVDRTRGFDFSDRLRPRKCRAPAGRFCPLARNGDNR